jgi:hypothetical protein
VHVFLFGFVAHVLTYLFSCLFSYSQICEGKDFLEAIPGLARRKGSRVNKAKNREAVPPTDIWRKPDTGCQTKDQLSWSSGKVHENSQKQCNPEFQKVSQR